MQKGDTIQQTTRQHQQAETEISPNQQQQIAAVCFPSHLPSHTGPCQHFPQAQPMLLLCDTTDPNKQQGSPSDFHELRAPHPIDFPPSFAIFGISYPGLAIIFY
jgi:hypothetical protein